MNDSKVALLLLSTVLFSVFILTLIAPGDVRAAPVLNKTAIEITRKKWKEDWLGKLRANSAVQNDGCTDCPESSENDIIQEQINATDIKFFQGDLLGIDPNVLSIGSEETFNTAAVQNLWQGGRIPYFFVEKGAGHIAGTPFADNVLKAMKAISDATCIRFEPKTEQDTDYIKIIAGNRCVAYPGYQQGLNLVAYHTGGCNTQRKILHELLHAIGFNHEMARNDRDDYVEINWDNIKPEVKRDFDKYDSNAQGFPFDSDSVMMYEENYFAINSDVWTIRRKDGRKINSADALSPLDIASINKLYTCPEKLPLITFKNQKYWIPVPSNPVTFKQAQTACAEKQAKLAVINETDITAFAKAAGSNFADDIYWLGNEAESDCNYLIMGQDPIIITTDCGDQVNFICDFSS